MFVALAVGFSVTLAAVATYVAVRHELYAQVNNNLATDVSLAPPPQVFFGELHPENYQGFEARTGDEVQVIGLNPSNQQVVYSIDPSTGLMVEKKFFGLTSQAQEVFRAGSTGSEVVQTLTGSNGHEYRVATVNEGDLTVQIGYPMANTDRTLDFLRLMLLLVVLAGVALAMALGWAVGRATMKPVEDLTVAAEHVAETQDLSATIDDSGNDELARLARSFNAMLAALSASRQRQAHLVSDAGHELRTPLTSLRTNIEVLMRNRNLGGEDRDALLSDVNAQVQELSTLVGDLVDLAREDERPDAEPEVVAFDDLVRKAVERARRRAMSVHFELDLEPGPVKAHAGLLERAVMNVLDNAAKWSPSGGTVRVGLATIDDQWHLRVSDEGPGIAAEDLPHIFERFYRAASARSLPGSGLGLAIVQRVVSTHDGAVNVSSGPTGGTVVEIVLPAFQPSSPVYQPPSAVPAG
jgi:two-component system sensor histidine kinase MprB